MTLQEIFEQSRERLTSALSGADAPAAVRVMNAELDRILYTFNDQEESARVREAAGAMMQVAKAACSLTDSAGETRIYGRTEYGQAPPARGRVSRMGLMLLVLGLIGAAVTVTGAQLLFSSVPSGAPPRWLLAGVPLLSAAALFFAGLLLRGRKGGAKETLHAETTVDASLIYTRLLAVILVMDKCLEETRSGERLEEKERTRAQVSALDGAELELLSQLLEDAYGRRGEDEQAEAEISRIRFYLHRRNVEVVDWSAGAAASAGAGGGAAEALSGWFDMMPAFDGGTIRPALVSGGVLLKKGMASAGRG